MTVNDIWFDMNGLLNHYQLVNVLKLPHVTWHFHSCSCVVPEICLQISNMQFMALSAFIVVDLHCHCPKIYLYLLSLHRAALLYPTFWWGEVSVVMSPPVLFTAWWQ